jgi:mono/diheme cytochrome c family protein
MIPSRISTALLIVAAIFATEKSVGAQQPAAAASAAAAPSPEQMQEGQKIYMTICVACHMPTGIGLFPVFPPLTKSPYVSGSAERMIAMVLKGQMPPFTIDGKTYAGVMIAQEAVLDDQKIANVVTYVRNSFGNTASPVSADLVAATRKKFLERKTPWTQPEIDGWKE